MLFTPRLFVLKGPNERETLRKPALIGQSLCIVPRADCSFRRMRLMGRSAEAKKAAVLKARNESLADEDGIKLVIDKAPADTGAADIRAVGAGYTGAGLWGYGTSSAHNGRYLPESLAQIPHDDGVRLVRGLSGFDGQIWSAGNLIASRWWAREPRDTDWAVFIQAAGEILPQISNGTFDSARPAAIELPWRNDLPIFDIDQDRLSEVFAPLKLAVAAGTIAGCFALYTAGQYTRETIALSQVNEQTAELRGETEQIQSERRRALANMNYVRRYRALGDNGTVLAGFDALANVLGTTDLGIARMSLRDGSAEVRLGGEDEISVPDVVTLLEAQPNISNVSVSLEGDKTIIIKADISAPRKLASAAPTPAQNGGDGQ